MPSQLIERIKQMTNSISTPEEKNLEPPVCEDEESIGDMEEDQGSPVGSEPELPAGHHSCIPSQEKLKCLEQNSHSRKKVENVLKR